MEPEPALTATVAVARVRSGRRRGAAVVALDLIASTVRAVVTPDVVVLPHLARRGTTADALSAAIDALRAAGADRLVVVGAGADADLRFDRLGHRGEAWGRPVRFVALDREEPAWEPISIDLANGTRRGVRAASTIGSAGCRLALAPAGGPIWLDALGTSLHPDDRRSLDRARPAGLVELARFVRPQLRLVEGPGLAVAGEDPVAVDAVAASIFGGHRRHRARLAEAEAAGLGVADLDRIAILGDGPAVRGPHRRIRRIAAKDAGVR